MDVTKQCRDIDELLPAAKKACNLFLSECQKAGLDIFIVETYRSQARQNYLYEQGRSRAGQKVTWTKSSRHTRRLAWDIAVRPPKNLYDETTLKKAGAIAKRLGITWGGSWKGTPDMPHFEVTRNWTPPASAAQPKPSTPGKYRVYTGIFKTGEEAEKQAKLIGAKLGYKPFAKEKRVWTGTFNTLESAIAAQQKISREFGFNPQIRQEK